MEKVIIETAALDKYDGGFNKKGDFTMEATKTIEAKDAKVRERLSDIDLLISWREIANSYFERSASWLYHKFDGIDGNGGKGGFTPEEKERLRGALFDVARRIRQSAEAI